MSTSILTLCLYGSPCPWAIWKEKGLLTLGNKDNKHGKEVLQLLEAVNLPNQIAIMHCPGHKNIFHLSQGNQTANKAARQAAQGPPLLGALISHLELSELKPHYAE